MVTQGYGGLLVRGCGLTLALALAAMALALMLGLLVALSAGSARRCWRWPAGCYVGLVRGVPELLMVLLVYFGSSLALTRLAGVLGHDDFVEIGPFAAGALALGLVYGAYCAEALRGALAGIDPGWTDAALALGLSRLQRLRYIVLPQLWRLALPALGNLLLALLKDTALVAVIGAGDLLHSATIAVTNTRQPFTFYLLAAAMYLALTLVLSWLLALLERWSWRGQPRALG